MKLGSIPRLPGIVLALFLTSAGCGFLGDDDDPPARIVPGESVEGIPLGASNAEAEAVLGAFGTYCGLTGFRAWCGASFFTANGDPTSGLRLRFIEEFSSDGWLRPGPLDFFVIAPPYDGTTKEGVGIGSRKALVHAAYGSPDSVRIGSGFVEYYYCFDYSRHFALTFREGLVASMHLGWFKPAPDGVRICD